MKPGYTTPVYSIIYIYVGVYSFQGFVFCLPYSSLPNASLEMGVLQSPKPGKYVRVGCKKIGKKKRRKHERKKTMYSLAQLLISYGSN